jgi:hypothetical protein
LAQSGAFKAHEYIELDDKGIHALEKRSILTDRYPEDESAKKCNGGGPVEQQVV